MTEKELSDLLPWAIALTTEAADRAVKRLQGDYAIHRKVDGTVVTDIDREIERYLRAEITARFPKHAIFGEEYGYDRDATPSDAPLWAVDPIDGTVNLANGFPLWCVSVGLVVAGEPVLGVVICPQIGETFAGAKGSGATLNGIPLSALPGGGPTTFDDAYGICSASVRRVDFTDVPVRTRILGSAALDVCWVAAGRLKGCQSIGVSLYDVAAGLCLCREVGASVEWLAEREPWSAVEMANNGKRENDVLITAPLATLAFLRERLRFRPNG